MIMLILHKNNVQYEQIYHIGKTMNITIETERLILRPLVSSDAEAAFKWCGDKDVNKYMIYPLYHSADEVREWVESRNIDDSDNYDLGIVLKGTGELIGSGGLTYDKDRDAWEVGYNLRKDMWGQGIAVEAMNGIIAEVDKTRGIKTLYGSCAKENARSRRVLEKLGLIYYRDRVYEKADGSRSFDAIELIKHFE